MSHYKCFCLTPLLLRLGSCEVAENLAFGSRLGHLDLFSQWAFTISRELTLHRRENIKAQFHVHVSTYRTQRISAYEAGKV